VHDERAADFVIIGRTDAREPHGLDEALRRGHVYADADADVVFVGPHGHGQNSKRWPTSSRRRRLHT
jgi:2-methylisocitrate lyase-like PEP mutase family enzyme